MRKDFRQVPYQWWGTVVLTLSAWYIKGFINNMTVFSTSIYKHHRKHKSFIQAISHWQFCSQRANNVESISKGWHYHESDMYISMEKNWFQQIPSHRSQNMKSDLYILKPLSKDAKIKSIYIFTKQFSISLSAKSLLLLHTCIRFPLIPMQQPPANLTLPFSCHKPCYKAYLIHHKGT